MKHRLHTEIDIDAPPQAVWRILTDLDRYSEWNPFVVSSREPSPLVNPLTNRLQPPGGKPRTFKPTVTIVDPPRTFEWLGHLGLPRHLRRPAPLRAHRNTDRHPPRSTRGLQRSPRQVRPTFARRRHRCRVRRHEHRPQGPCRDPRTRPGRTMIGHSARGGTRRCTQSEVQALGAPDVVASRQQPTRTGEPSDHSIGRSLNPMSPPCHARVRRRPKGGRSVVGHHTDAPLAHHPVRTRPVMPAGAQPSAAGSRPTAPHSSSAPSVLGTRGNKALNAVRTMTST